MLKKILAIAALTASSAFASAEPGKPIVIIGHGGNYARGTLPRDDSWYGLYCNGSGCETGNANVRITSSTAKNVLGEDEPIDVLKTDGKPLALFHGVPLNPGKVATWFKSEGLVYDSGHYSRLRKLDRWQMPWGATPLTISRVKLPGYEGYRYHIGDGVTKQFMFRLYPEGHYGGDTTPYIHWVGDLDGDGKIDLLLSLPDDNCGFDVRLYLSSQAGEGEFVRKAAQLAGREPACGC